MLARQACLRLPQLPLQSDVPTLFSFRTRSGPACHLIDTRVAVARRNRGVRLTTPDRYAKSEVPEALAIYAQPGQLTGPTSSACIPRWN